MRRLSPFLLPALLAASGCRVFGVALPCDDDAQCPPAQSCVEGVCATPSPTDGGAGRADGGGEGEGEGEGEGDAGVVVAVDPDCVVELLSSLGCGGPCVVSDSFDDALAPRWIDVSDVGSSADVGGGTLTLSGGQAGVISFAPILVAGDHVQVELDTGAVDAQQVVTFALLQSQDAARMVRMEVEQGALRGIINDVDTGANDAAELGTFDRATMRSWRMRVDDGHVYFDTAPDGTSWNERGSVVALPFLDAPVYVAFSSQGGAAAWALRGVADDRSPCGACTLNDLHDSLCDGPAGPLFRARDGSNQGLPTSCVLTEGDTPLSAGLTIQVGEGDDDVLCGYLSTMPYALQGGYLTLPVDLDEALQGGDSIDGSMAVNVMIRTLNGDTWVGLQLRGDALLCGEFDQRQDQMLDGNANSIDIASIESLRLAFDLQSDTLVCTAQFPSDSWTVNGVGLGLARFDPGLVGFGVFGFNALESPRDLVFFPF